MLEPFDTHFLAPVGLAIRWARQVVGAKESLAIDQVRAFAAGTRVHVEARGWAERQRFAVGADDGSLADELPPWLPERVSEEQLARARAGLGTIDSLDLRAVSSDGSLLFFAIARNGSEVPDPDAGSVWSCDASLGLWDVRGGAWRWETTNTPDELGVGSAIMGNGSFEFSPADQGIFGTYYDDRSKGTKRTRRLYDALSGQLRPPTVEEQPLSTRDVVATVGTLDLAPIGDEVTAATLLAPGAVVVGTKKGRLLCLESLSR